MRVFQCHKKMSIQINQASFDSPKLPKQLEAYSNYFVCILIQSKQIFMEQIKFKT